MISSLLTLSDVLSLAAVAGNQIAWWHLGFRERRAVVQRARQGIPHPDPDVWHDARQWARQMLDAPWWWRLARAIVISGFGVLGLASTLGVAVELQAEVAIGTGVLAAVPLAIAWAWRQTQKARLIDRVEPTERNSTANPRWVPVVLLATAALAMSASVVMIVQTVRADYEDVYGCAVQPEDEHIRAWWVRHKGKSGLAGCPTGHTGHTAGGQVYVRTTNGVITSTAKFGPFLLSRDAFDVWQRNWEKLGEPTGAGLGDGSVNFVNFEGGHVRQTSGEPAIAEFGTSYRPTQTVGGPCTKHDRPCVVRADRGSTTIRLAWHWGIADAFNVSWRAIDGQDTTNVEVAGNEYTITGLTPGDSYVLHVQACDKQLLTSSRCTPSSAYLIAP
jgi:hypothetical protein